MSTIFGRRPIQNSKDKLFYMCEITGLFNFINPYLIPPSYDNNTGYLDYETCLRAYFKHVIATNEPTPLNTKLIPMAIGTSDTSATHAYNFGKKVIFVNDKTPDDTVIDELMRDHTGIIF